MLNFQLVYLSSRKEFSMQNFITNFEGWGGLS